MMIYYVSLGFSILAGIGGQVLLRSAQMHPM